MGNQLKKRMVAAEQKAYFQLYGAIGMLGIVSERLEPRIQANKGCKSLLHSAIGLLLRLADRLGGTIPDDQLKHMSRQIQGLYMHVGIRDKVADQKHAEEYGRFFSDKELETVMCAIRECCRCCTIDDPQQQKQCPYAKLMNALPAEKPDEHAAGCGWFAAWL